MMEKKVSVLARVKAREGMENRVRRACLELVAPSREDKGCISYDLHQSTDDRGLFFFVESWVSKKDIENHLGTPHCAAFDEKVNTLLAEPEEITFMEKLS
jgi:quinol monooxygenase YgiN